MELCATRELTPTPASVQTDGLEKIATRVSMQLTFRNVNVYEIYNSKYNTLKKIRNFIF